MKKIGFIDYYLDEWHANNYPAWIEANCQATGRQYKLCYAYADRDGATTTDAWCRKFGVEKCASAAEVVEKSDCIVVLSPDNPEQHEHLCEVALRSGKPVYVDKTFAPDAETSRRLIRLAEDSGTPMYSSSALRFADELLSYRTQGARASSCVVMGGGKFDVYLVHIAEMLVTVMGADICRVMATNTGLNPVFTVAFSDGRQGVLVQGESADIPFQMLVEQDGGAWFQPIASDFFQSFIDSMLAFFDSKIPAVPHAQTQAVMALLDACKKAVKHPFSWIEV